MWIERSSAVSVVDWHTYSMSVQKNCEEFEILGTEKRPGETYASATYAHDLLGYHSIQRESVMI